MISVCHFLISNHGHFVLADIVETTCSKRSQVRVRNTSRGSISPCKAEFEEIIVWVRANIVAATVLFVHGLHVVLLITQCLCLRCANNSLNRHVEKRVIADKSGGGTVASVVDNTHTERLVLSATISHKYAESNRPAAHSLFWTASIAICSGDPFGSLFTPPSDAFNIIGV